VGLAQQTKAWIGWDKEMPKVNRKGSNRTDELKLCFSRLSSSSSHLQSITATGLGSAFRQPPPVPSAGYPPPLHEQGSATSAAILTSGDAFGWENKGIG
jgi:hypothetical protein